MLSDDRLAEIEALAKAATAGSWVRDTAVDSSGSFATTDIVSLDEDGFIEADVAHFNRAEDAAFMEACGPKTVLAMVDELRALRLLAAAAERVVRLRNWTSGAEVHPGRGEAERDLARLVEEWGK